MALVAIEVRPAIPTDMVFVYDSWIRSYRYVADEITDTDYYPFQRQRITSLLESSTVKVAHPTEAPNVIAGWSCADGEVLHYVYTREAYRKSGIASLLTKGCTICTHMTDSRRPDSFKSWKRRRAMRYIPYLLDGV